MTFEEWWNTKDYPDCCLLRCKRAFNEGRAELEKENAELKADYKVLSCSVGDFDELQNKLEEEQRKNNGLSDNLTKANSLLEDVYKIAMEDWNDPKWHDQVLQKAREYLKEIEK